MFTKNKVIFQPLSSTSGHLGSWYYLFTVLQKVQMCITKNKQMGKHI